MKVKLPRLTIGILHERQAHHETPIEHDLPEALRGEDLVHALVVQRQQRKRRAFIFGGSVVAVIFGGGAIFGGIHPKEEAGVAAPVPASADAFTTTQPAPTTRTAEIPIGAGDFQPANSNLCNVISYSAAAKALLDLPGVTDVPCSPVSESGYMASAVWSPSTEQVGVLKSITVTEYADRGPNNVSRFDARRVNPHTDEQINGMLAAYYADSATTIVRLANARTAVDLSVQVTLGGNLSPNNTAQQTELMRQAGIAEIRNLIPYFQG